MNDKKCGTPSRKRLSKVVADEYWDCSVCTFTNSPEAFKCSICDVRKGTSTRKPRLNQHIVAQQEATRLVAQMPQSPIAALQKEEGQKVRHDETKRPKLKGIDRSSPVTMAVTVDDVTIMFTEFKPKKMETEERSRSRDRS